MCSLKTKDRWQERRKNTAGGAQVTVRTAGRWPGGSFAGKTGALGCLPPPPILTLQPRLAAQDGEPAEPRACSLRQSEERERPAQSQPSVPVTFLPPAPPRSLSTHLRPIVTAWAARMSSLSLRLAAAGTAGENSFWRTYKIMQMEGWK